MTATVLRANRGLSEPMAASHVHADLELNYVFRGRVRVRVGSQLAEVAAGGLMAFWAAVPHQVLEVDAGTDFMWLAVPLSTVLRWDVGDRFVPRLLGGAAFVDREGRPGDAALARRWLDEGSGTRRAASATRRLERELEARVRRLATLPATSERTATRALEVLEKITAFLAARHRRPIALADVGQAVGLHPNYALTVFRKCCGMTVWQYLTRLRIARAQALLLTTDLPVADVGKRAGFGSQSSFYDLFVRECGVAPAAFRRRD